MGMGRGSSLLRGEYYLKYYILNKEKLRRNYLEKKQKKFDNEKLYEAYGGEEEYYKHVLLKMGFLKLN